MKEQIPYPMSAVYAQVGNESKAPRDGELVRFYSDKESLLTAGRSSKIDQLFVESITQLGRNTVEALGLLRNLKHAGVTVHLLKEGRVV